MAKPEADLASSNSSSSSIKPSHLLKGAHPLRFFIPRPAHLRVYTSIIDKLESVGQADLVLQYHDVSVYREDLDNLRAHEWLNDNNITFMYEFLEHTYLSSHASEGSIILLRPSMAYLLLQFQGPPRNLEDVLPPIGKARFVFLPINDNPDVEAVEGGLHWSLLVVSMRDKKALYYDTLRDTNYDAALATTKKLAQFLETDLEFVPVTTPQQVNSSDCGILVCELTSLFVKRLASATNDVVNLGLSGVSLSASRGRLFLLRTILHLIAERNGDDQVAESTDGPTDMDGIVDDDRAIPR